MQVIPSACKRCEAKGYEVSNMCKGCLAHPCMEVCPKGAISMVNGKSYIDQEKCIKCGRCAEVCPYGAILKLERPCASACGMDAISSDEHGRAVIDYDKCVSCGMCIVNLLSADFLILTGKLPCIVFYFPFQVHLSVLVYVPWKLTDSQLCAAIRDQSNLFLLTVRTYGTGGKGSRAVCFQLPGVQPPPFRFQLHRGMRF